MKKSRPEPKKHNTRPSAKSSRDGDELRSGFSDSQDDFYVDETTDRREARRPERRENRREDRRESRRDDRLDDLSEERREERRREIREERLDREPLIPERKPMSPLKRKLTRILSTFAIVAVILVVGVVLSLTVLFKTERYEIIGNRLYLDSDIISTCAIDKGENIFLAPKRPAEERIVRRFPYIDSVNVTFGIPDTIRIEIKEAVEGYLFKVSDNEYLIISTKGRILNRVSDISGHDLPIFIGPTLSSGEIGDYVSYDDDTVLNIIDSITQAFYDNGYQGITEIDATNPAAVTFTYDSRIKVKLGIPEDISYKVRTAMTIINNNIDVNSTNSVMGVLDVSRCNITKRSYFNEEDITATEPPTETPTEPSSEAPTEYAAEAVGYGDDDHDTDGGYYSDTDTDYGSYDQYGE